MVQTPRNLWIVVGALCVLLVITLIPNPVQNSITSLVTSTQVTDKTQPPAGDGNIFAKASPVVLAISLVVVLGVFAVLVSLAIAIPRHVMRTTVRDKIKRANSYLNDGLTEHAHREYEQLQTLYHRLPAPVKRSVHKDCKTLYSNILKK